MTAKEKAIELYEKYYYKTPSSVDSDFTDTLCKQYALIAVNELIEQESKTDDFYEVGSYWKKVKQEVEKL